MNDYIVWDKFNEVFYKQSDHNTKTGFFNKILLAEEGGNCLTYHRYIGKKDINNKKIFSESSIFNIIDCEDSIYKVVWNKESSKYQVERITPDDGDWLVSDFDEMDGSDFTIIDTIQQNKLGLIK